MQLIDSVCQFYQSLDAAAVEKLADLYHEDIEFIDPVTRHKGLPALNEYFAALLDNTQKCRFDIHQVSSSQQDHFLQWTMFFSHPKLGEQEITVEGISQIKTSGNRIIYQRDYYDLGQMLYEHIPMVGRLIKHVKGRLAS